MTTLSAQDTQFIKTGSTLAKLMLGFLQPQEGSIKLDDKDIRYMSANELRNVFVVPQDTTLFSGTLYENLTLANPHASFEQIIMACQLAWYTRHD